MLYYCSDVVASKLVFVDDLTFPLVSSHSTDSEPHASPGLSECERRKPKMLCVSVSVETLCVRV